MTIKEQLIQEIEQAPEESLIKFMRIWQLAKESSHIRANRTDTKLSDFFRQSPLAEVVNNGELDLSRDRLHAYCPLSHHSNQTLRSSLLLVCSLLGRNLGNRSSRCAQSNSAAFLLLGHSLPVWDICSYASLNFCGISDSGSYGYAEPNFLDFDRECCLGNWHCILSAISAAIAQKSIE
jgi:hypothetical protein